MRYTHVFAAFLTVAPLMAQKVVITDITKPAWTDTGIDVVAGQRLTIFSYGCASTRAAGSFTEQNIEAWGTPDGSVFGLLNTEPAASHYLAPNRSRQALVGKIADSTFNVGSMFSRGAPLTGRLYLAFNDHEVGGYEDNFGYFVSFITTPSTILASEHHAMPDLLPSFSLEQNFPNPFNPSTIIQYRLDRATDIEIKVYDALGRLVRSLYGGRQESGEQSVEWDGKDQTGVTVAAGTYFYQVGDSQSLQAKKMLFLK